MRAVLCAAVLAAALVVGCDADVVSVILRFDGWDYESIPAVIPGWVALGNLTTNYNQTGWDFLEIQTSADFPDHVQAYAAGVAEAFLTGDLIKMHWKNTVEGYCKWQGEAMCERLQNYTLTNYFWIQSMVKKHSASDPYWHQVGLVSRQLEGLEDELSFYPRSDPGVRWLNLAGDLEDLETALKSPSERLENPKAHWGGRALGAGHCSALIKLLPKSEDLYTSQVTWNSFQSMLRIQKRYVFRYGRTQGGERIPGSVVSFSSYPGIISSQDDFNVLGSGLVTQETTIGNNNNDLWSNLKPEGQVFEWVRAVVANNLATSGQEWADIFSKYNSGTYNNQWMVVDYKRFKRGDSPLRKGLLHVLEQIPGHIVHMDVTPVLEKQQYWASYNSPYFKFIFNMSGDPALVAQYGNWFSYDHTPRAEIFRRDHSKVKDVHDMLKLMRYNDFKHDPLSRCNCTPPFSGENAISARCDLNPKNGSYPFGALGHRDHGGTDAKITTAKLVPMGEFLSIAGPTYDQQPPFRWSTSDFEATTPHHGHPDLFQFDPIQWKWQWK